MRLTWNYNATPPCFADWSLILLIKIWPLLKIDFIKIYLLKSHIKKKKAPYSLSHSRKRLLPPSVTDQCESSPCVCVGAGSHCSRHHITTSSFICNKKNKKKTPKEISTHTSRGQSRHHQLFIAGLSHKYNFLSIKCKVVFFLTSGKGENAVRTVWGTGSSGELGISRIVELAPLEICKRRKVPSELCSRKPTGATEFLASAPLKQSRVVRGGVCVSKLTAGVFSS